MKFNLHLKDTHLDILDELKEKHSISSKDLVKRYVKSALNLQDNDLIFDIACGPGNIAERIAKNWPLVNVIGIDGSKEMLKEAENRLTGNFTKNLSYELIDINSIVLSV